MKTTLDLPDQLLRQAKQRALLQGCTLKQLVADYIRQGLQGPSGAQMPFTSAKLRTTAEGLPVFPAEQDLDKARIDLSEALQLEQTCLMQEDRRHVGLPS